MEQKGGRRRGDMERRAISSGCRGHGGTTGMGARSDWELQ